MRNNSNLYLGILFIILGGLLLLKNLNFIDVHFNRIWDLWPFILILWGLKYLPMKATVRTGVNVLLLLLFFLLLLIPESTYLGKYMESNAGPGNWKMIHVNMSDDEEDNVITEGNDYYFVADLPEGVKEGQLSLGLGAIDMEIGEPTSKLFEFTAEDYPFPLMHQVKVSEDIARIKIQNTGSVVSLNGNHNGDAELHLNPDLDWSLEIETGASSMNLDLTPYKVKKIKMASGASETEIFLGDKSGTTRVEIAGGAMDLTIHIPKNVGVELKKKAVFSFTKYEGFKKVNKNLYRTENFDNVSKKIYIEIESALSNLDIKRY